MLQEIGGYQIPLTLKQMDNSAGIQQKKISLDQSPGKILDSFGAILQKQVNETSRLQIESEKAQESFATGGNVSLHEVMIKAEKADMALQLTVQLRNKLLAAYKEIERMNV